MFCPEQARDLFQILNESSHLGTPGFIVLGSKDRGRMHGGHHVRRQQGYNHLSALAGDTKMSSQQALRGARAQTYQNLGLDRIKLRIQPGAACLDFGIARLLMNASFPALGRRPLEVLDHIRDVDFGALDARLGKRLVKNSSCGTDERVPLSIFLITRLLSH